MAETRSHRVLATKVFETWIRERAAGWFGERTVMQRRAWYYDFGSFVVYEIRKIKCLREQLTSGETKRVLRREPVDR